MAGLRAGLGQSGELIESGPPALAFDLILEFAGIAQCCTCP